MDRGRTEEMKMVRNRLMWVVCLPTIARVISGPGMLARSIAESVVLLHVARVCVDIYDPCCHQRPLRCPGSGSPLVARSVSDGLATTGAMLILEACAATWGHELLLRAMSGFMAV